MPSCNTLGLQVNIICLYPPLLSHKVQKTGMQARRREQCLEEGYQALKNNSFFKKINLQGRKTNELQTFHFTVGKNSHSLLYYAVFPYGTAPQQGTGARHYGQFWPDHCCQENFPYIWSPALRAQQISNTTSNSWMEAVHNWRLQWG